MLGIKRKWIRELVLILKKHRVQVGTPVTQWVQYCYECCAWHGLRVQQRHPWGHRTRQKQKYVWIAQAVASLDIEMFQVNTTRDVKRATKKHWVLRQGHSPGIKKNRHMVGLKSWLWRAGRIEKWVWDSLKGRDWNDVLMSVLVRWWGRKWNWREWYSELE